MAKNLRTSLKQSIRASSKASLVGSNVFGSSPLDLRFALQKTLDPRVTFTRASTGTYVGSDGAIKTATTNEARFDHNPTTGESLGLLVEEARTNLLSASEEMVTAPWGLATATGVANNGIAPDGTTTADKIISTGGGCFRAGVGVANATAYTYSVFLKYVTGTGVITQVGFERFGSTPLLGSISVNLLTGTITNNGAPVTSSSITRYSNNWYRVSVTATSTDVTTTVVNYTGTSGNEFLVWGAQLEAGAFPTSYIPTTSATATRAADVATITGSNFSSWYNQTEGTVFADVTARPDGLVCNFDDGSFNNRKPQIAIGAGASCDVAYVTAGSTVASFSQASTSNQRNLIATAYATDNYGFTSNGATPIQDSLGAVPSTVTTLRFGRFHNGIVPLYGTIKRLTYWPVRLSNTTLQAITTS